MTRAELRALCRALPGAEETFPFGLDTVVYKVGGKMFALCGLGEGPARVSLKCEPEYALALRAAYPGTVTPGYHLNKTHWNTVDLEGGVSEALLRELVAHSYRRVVQGLPRRVREGLGREAAGLGA